MKNALLFTIIGTGIAYVLHYFFVDAENLWLGLYLSFSFGLGWGMAYFLDREDFTLPKKLGISFCGIVFLVGLGILFFDAEKAVSTVMKYAIVFTAYYLLASLRSSKTLKK